MLQRLREWLTLALLVLLPFHAFGVTVLTKLIAGPGHAPLPQLALWKEGLLGIILLIAALEILRTRKMPKIDLPDALILFLIGLAVFLSGLHPIPPSLFALGFKYDFIPLVAFLILRRVSWSDAFRKTAVSSILWVAGIVSVYGILTFFLPASFFSWLGYSDLHSLYVADGPLAAFQQIGGSSLHRVQSTFSGPNQFGIWLLLPIALCIVSVTLSVVEESTRRVHGSTTLSMTRLALFLAALFLTFSRAAWIAAAVIIAISLYPFVKPYITRGRFLWSAFAAVILLFGATALFPNTLLRLSSSRGHIERPIEALQTMIAHPFGLGLGSAGPATNRFSDTCVMLRPEDDPSWAKDRADLCVFLGDVQVQPADRACHCPFLPENWYLQIGVELGFVGFILYVALIVLVLLRLKGSEIGDQGSGIFYALIGVSIAGLFLHAWEDAAIAYVVWILIAVMFSTQRRPESP